MHLVAAFFVLVTAMSAARADATAAAGACYSISNADARTVCLARVHKDPSRCYSVQAADLRTACLAEVRGK